MIAVITGDIIKSRTRKSNEWQPILKSVLNQYGKTPASWEMFRGDSFQLVLKPAEALTASIHLKAAIKQLAKLDVRLGIGLGTQEFKAKKITESTGTAFIRSGKCFDELKKQNIAFDTGNDLLNETLNIMLSVASLVIDNWSTTVAHVIVATLENTKMNQQEIANLLEKSQSSISEALKRGGFEEVKQIDAYYRKKLHVL